MHEQHRGNSSVKGVSYECSVTREAGGGGGGGTRHAHWMMTMILTNCDWRECVCVSVSMTACVCLFLFGKYLPCVFVYLVRFVFFRVFRFFVCLLLVHRSSFEAEEEVEIMILNLFWFLSTIVLFFWREILFYVYCLSSSRVGNPIAIGMYQHTVCAITVPALNTSMYVPMCVCLLFLVFTLWYDAECSPPLSLFPLSTLCWHITRLASSLTAAITFWLNIIFDVYRLFLHMCVSATTFNVFVVVVQRNICSFVSLLNWF